ncbi:MAG: hypothetical protein [Olavius algarvensis Delta 4 endosymbiont]|nr:MAG: hypothetical protein [Olavius algarvensis Delta 4 endosymbiont]
MRPLKNSLTCRTRSAGRFTVARARLGSRWSIGRILPGFQRLFIQRSQYVF